MSDFENRVREALGSAAEGAPDARGLADAARRRHRARRRTTMAAASAVVVAAVAVPLALTVGGGTPEGTGPGGEPTRAGDPTPGSGVPNGYRAESWRDLEVHVPSTWGQGAITTWCTSGDQPEAVTPVVDRPETVRVMIACTPGTGYGLQFLDPAAYDPAYPPGQVRRIEEAGRGGEQPFPAGAWVGYAATDHAVALVVAPSEYVARYVLDSASPIDVEDSRGCVAGVYANTDFSGPDDVTGDLTVCRYVAGETGREPGYWLAQSTSLGPAESRAVRAAVEEAPDGQAPFTRCDDPTAEFYLVLGEDGIYAWVYNEACGSHEVLTADEDDIAYHRPTPELLELLGSPYGSLRR